MIAAQKRRFTNDVLKDMFEAVPDPQLEHSIQSFINSETFAKIVKNNATDAYIFGVHVIAKLLNIPNNRLLDTGHLVSHNGIFFVPEDKKAPLFVAFRQSAERELTVGVVPGGAMTTLTDPVKFARQLEADRQSSAAYLATWNPPRKAEDKSGNYLAAFENAVINADRKGLSEEQCRALSVALHGIKEALGEDRPDLVPA